MPSRRAVAGPARLGKTLSGPSRRVEIHPRKLKEQIPSDRSLEKHADDRSPNIATLWHTSDGFHKVNGVQEDKDSELEKLDADIPRVVQWVDEDDLSEEYSEAALNNQPPVDGLGHPKLESLEADLSSLPFGTLLNARLALAETSADNDTESDDDNLGEVRRDGPPSESDAKEKGKQKREWNTNPKKDLDKRANKHAPIEITSKKPMTRRRTVVEVHKPIARDPRFMQLSGEFSQARFQSQYGFLSKLHTSELWTLRDNLKRARKLLSSSPEDLREERTREVVRLDLAVKRAESAVNEDRREKIEREALERVEKEEKGKRMEGKRGWWMKESEKKELLLRARYDAIADVGGTRAVKKVIEKRQKKVAQKEKKARPFPPSRSGTDGSDARYTKQEHLSNYGTPGQRPGKRQKVG